MNRRALDEDLRQAILDFQSHDRPAALLMLDVDHFKRFNDMFGHVAGDQALVHVADALRSQARTGDAVARFGGEEFAVIFADSTAARVCRRAEAFRRAIGSRGLSLGGREIRVSASAGLADLAKGDTIADWIKRADTALYAAKNAGRDCGFQMCGTSSELIVSAPDESSQPTPAETPAASSSEADTALAADSFADATFVLNISRRIAEWRRGGATLTVLLARLDGPVNDVPTQASEASHSPLRTIQLLAKESIRQMDVLTLWQGNGLAILLPGASSSDAKSVVHRLRSSLAAKNKEQDSAISVSIGIAEGIEGNDAKRVLQRAWLALEAARTAGPGNTYLHDGLKAVGLRLLAATR
jgi:diguanylate cyclase